MPRSCGGAAALLALALASAPLLLLAPAPAAAADAATGGAPAAAADALRDRFPWDVPRSEAAQLPWEGLQNDLPALLKIQARGKQIALLVFNEAFSSLALNCLTSLVHYGNSPNYVVAAAGAKSLEYCKALRLPCFDGGSLLTNVTAWEHAAGVAAADAGAASAGAAEPSPAEAGAGRYSAEWFHLVWMKTLVAHAVNKLGYDILFADADVVFLKDAWSAYNGLLDRYEADGTFMREQGNYTRSDGAILWQKYLNSGNFMLRHNSRTRSLMEMWRAGYEFQVNMNGNQLWLNRLDKMGYKICHDRDSCELLREEGWAAIKPHPNQFGSDGPGCTPARLEGGPCGDRRLYVHAVCRQGHRRKAHALKQLGLWFVHVDPEEPTKVTVNFPKDGPLPCGGTTWNDAYPYST